VPVVDASVCVAVFKSDEPGHADAVGWLATASRGEEPIVAPVIVLAEVAAALGRAGINNSSSGEVIQLLRSRQLLELFPVSEKLAARAAVLAAACRLRGADAIYVALADLLAVPLVTWDRQQLLRGAQAVRTLTPRAVADGGP
jgi:predicted nucleic acid-binding protein